MLTLHFCQVFITLHTTSVFTLYSFQDENDCLFAWVSARETGLAPNDILEQKVDYGGLLLQV